MDQNDDPFFLHQLMIKNICNSLELSFSICEKNKIIFTPLIEYLNLWSEILYVLGKKISVHDELFSSINLYQDLINLKNFWFSYNYEKLNENLESLECIKKNYFKDNFRKIKYKTNIGNSFFDDYEKLMDKWYGCFLTNIKM